jgi:hypothetical protein
MSTNLAARQLKDIRKSMERDLKRKDREKLAALRTAIKGAKLTRREKIRGVGVQCRAAKQANMARAKRARKRLRESIQRTRDRAKSLCAVSRGEAQAATLTQIEKAVSALEDERALQRQLAVWTRPKSCPVSKRGSRTRNEKRQESDCEVAANIEEPGLRVVWEHVKSKIKPGPRRTRTEAFYEWAAEHQGEVYEIQEADAEKALRALEQEERRMSREVKKAGRYKRRSPEELAEMLEAVPF